MPTETPNRPSRIGLEKCFPEREWAKTHIPLVTESAPGRRRSTPPPRQAHPKGWQPLPFAKGIAVRITPHWVFF